MKKAENKSKIRWIKRGGVSLALAAVIAAALVAGSFAAYTSVNKVKRVVSTMASSGLLFSSNYMGAYDSEEESFSIRTFSFNEEVSAPSFSISVCNYAQSNPKYINEKNITYTFTATLVDQNGKTYDISTLDLSRYALNGTAFTGSTMTLTGQSLTGGVKTKNVYTITVDKEHLTDVYVKVTAVPDEASKTAVSSKILARILRGTLAAAQRTEGWSGSFTDAKVSDAPSELDGFNYEISGYGNGTVTLTWDNSKVAVSPWFLETLESDSAVSDAKQNGSTITFTVQAGTDTTYRLQFYRVVPADENETSGDVQSYVTCSFQASSTEEGGDE